MTKKDILQNFNISNRGLVNMMLGRPIYKYSKEHKRSRQTGERKDSELIEGTDYITRIGIIYFTGSGIDKIRKQFGERK